LHLCKEKDDFWPGQERGKVEICLSFIKRIVWDPDEPWHQKKKKNTLLPATAIPVSVLEEEHSSLWDSACEKDSSLTHGPYHVAVSADGWMKETVSALQPPIRG